jgi:hypothetical protein
MLVRAPSQGQEDSADRPVYERAWFWGTIAGAAVAVGAGVFLLTRSSASYPTATMGPPIKVN